MIRAVILDLDGTVYVGEHEIPGAGDFVRACHARGIRCLFVTNRTNRTPDAVCDHLRGYGVPCDTEDVLTASQATAAYLEPGTAYILGEDGLRCALEARGFTVTQGERLPDYVIVGFDRFITYEKLKTACHWIARGARFVATNPDRALPLKDTCLPGTGALVAAVAAGSNTQPLMIGKPERHIMDMALARLNLEPHDVIAVGDSVLTDIPAGHAAGMRTVLLLTGVSRRDEAAAVSPPPTWIADDYDALSAIVFDHAPAAAEALR